MLTLLRLSTNEGCQASTIKYHWSDITWPGAQKLQPGAQTTQKFVCMFIPKVYKISIARFLQ